MTFDATNAELEQIRTERIDRNTDNPRLVFRPGELEELLESIRVHGVQVPISVYKEGRRYVLIDGERRWRCSLKLNKPTIPALVQPKPDALRNLLLMFNIHSLREQWDLLTIALKLPTVIELLEGSMGRRPTEKEISLQTGLNRSVIRRSRLLMELPEKYRNMILQELNKPKSEQKLTEDLFIEMERALSTVERFMPEAIPNRDSARKVLLKKFEGGVITNRVHFRLLPKIARAQIVGVDVQRTERILKRVLADNAYSLEDAYEASVGEAYKERDLGTRASTLLNMLEDVTPEQLDAELRSKLAALAKRIRDLI